MIPALGLPQILVLDTCVLISNVLRRALLDLAVKGYFQVAWSPVIGDEWRRNAARLWGVGDDDIARQWQELECEFPFADQGDIEPYKQGLRRSDPKDWHVVAAARCALARQPGSQVAVLTRNLKDFNRSELRSFGLGLIDPDLFLIRCHGQHPAAVRAMLERLPEQVVAPGRDIEPLNVLLRRERLFRFSKMVLDMTA